MERQQALPAQQLAVHAGELIHHRRQLHGGRVRFSQPEPIGDEARQRSAEAGRQAAIVLALEEVDIEAEVRCRQDRMSEDRVELLVPDFGRAERILIVAPARIRAGEIPEREVVLAVLEWHLEDARLLTGSQIADATGRD